MKKNRITFLVAELILMIIACIFIRKIFQEDDPQKRVAVIIPDSGDTRWEGLVNGLKQSAKVNDVHLIICNTDEIANAEDEKELIDEQLENNVDAFIICPAPGTDTKDMLASLQAEKQTFVLITEDAYMEDDAEATGFVTVKPDNYQIGYTLGRQIIENNTDGLDGRKIGMILGRAETEASTSRAKGLTDALSDYNCEIAWTYHEDGSKDICEVVNTLGTVDYIAAMDTEALDTLGENAENGYYNGAEIYGVGSSMKSVALLDYDRIRCLVIPDGYSIGYESVNEIAKKLERSTYTLKSHEEAIRVIYKDDLFSEETERFLYSYE